MLTSYNGVTITYDEIGNPLSYYNGSSYTFTWQGRELIGAVKGSNTMSFSYNDIGLRISKTVNGVTTHYIYDGDLLLSEYTDTQAIVYIYDANTAPIGFKYRSSSYENDAWDIYWYEKNLQGDIVAIYNKSGTKLVTYSYNAWGVTTKSYSNNGSTSTAAKNNLTYRGYYYDSDLGLYYLQSRYYDPEICRFINADDVSYLGANSDFTSYNLYSYCGNNPVMGYDPTGHFDWGWEEQAILGTTVLIIGLALLLAAPTGGSSLAVGALALSSTATVVASSVMVVTGTIMVGDAIAQATVNYAKQSKKSGKERATNKPSWVSQSDVDLSKSSQQNATDLLNNKYGSGNWHRGPKTEFNKIVKWIDRGLKVFTLIFSEMFEEN